MTKVIPFRDSNAPLKGAERKAAIKAYWKAAEGIATEPIGKAFSTVSTQPSCGKMGCDDALPLFVAGCRRQLRKIEYCLPPDGRRQSRLP
jgi:hypothetical protein